LKVSGNTVLMRIRSGEVKVKLSRYTPWRHMGEEEV
jgi:hypothetical protein